MNATSSSGYAKYQIRSSGMPRVLANESDVFTLDDVDDIDELKIPNGSTATKEEEKSRLVECRLDSDEEEEEGMIKPKEDDKGQNIRQSGTNVTQSKERCRLRDSFDMDTDSLSDDLDLLPPIPGAPSTSTSWRTKLYRFNCCNPRIPSKCTIM